MQEYNMHQIGQCHRTLSAALINNYNLSSANHPIQVPKSVKSANNWFMMSE
jgi:hypothetical protein